MSRINHATIMQRNNWHKRHVRELRESLDAFNKFKVDKGKMECAYCATIDNRRIGGSAITAAECGIL